MKSETLALLWRENPVHEDNLPGPQSVAARALKERILLDEAATTVLREPQTVRSASPHRPRRAFLTGAALVAAVAAAAAVFLTVGSPNGGPGVENAAAAVRMAATRSAAAAEHSGAAVVRITHNGELWGDRTISWHGGDLVLSSEDPGRQGRAGSQMLLVDGMMYGVENGAWVELGPPESIDPDSGTTPAEYLAAVREDVGGETLRRVAGAMRGLTTRQLDDGSTVYSGRVPAGLIARETGHKEGQLLRVLPFGYVAHDEAADPAAPLDAAVTVTTDGTIREIVVKWGRSQSAWTYTVTYSGLGTTAAPAAPANARPLRCAPCPPRLLP